MAYTRTNWVNDSPPRINAANLNKIEVGIEEAHTAIQAIIDDGGGGGGGVTHHAALTGRDATDQHPISAITGLQAALDAKAAEEHYHRATDITDGVLDPARLGTGSTGGATRFLREDSTWQEVEGGGGGGGGVTDHGDLTGRSAADQHPIGSITGLQAALDAKAAAAHDHDGVYVKPADLPAAPTWGTLTGKPAVIAAGATETAARDAIGAGTSNLTVGTGASNAKAGNWTPGLGDIPARSMLALTYSGTSWPARPTSRTDVTVWWVGGPDVRPSGALVGDIHTPDMED